MRILNATQIRSADRYMIEEFQFPGLLLMETAERKSAEFLLSHFPNSPLFYLLVGPGNNGGDGLVIARHLAWKGKEAFPHLVWILKGAGTMVGFGNHLHICPLGNAGMATGALATKLYGQHGTTASQILGQLGPAILRILEGNSPQISVL